MHSTLLVVVLAVGATVVATALNARRRRYEKQKVSGGRKSLVLNLFDRS